MNDNYINSLQVEVIANDSIWYTVEESQNCRFGKRMNQVEDSMRELKEEYKEIQDSICNMAQSLKAMQDAIVSEIKIFQKELETKKQLQLVQGKGMETPLTVKMVCARTI